MILRRTSSQSSKVGTPPSKHAVNDMESRPEDEGQVISEIDESTDGARESAWDKKTEALRTLTAKARGREVSEEHEGTVIPFDRRPLQETRNGKCRRPRRRAL